MGVEADPAEEIKRLQRCISDLISLLALPALWSGSGHSQIVGTVLDTLLGMLRLDLVYARLRNPVDRTFIWTIRVAQSRQPRLQAEQICEALDRVLKDDPESEPLRIQNPFGDGDISILPLRLGLQGEVGIIVAGSERADFPKQTERLLLSVAANQAFIGLQDARQLNEQTRAAKVAEERLHREETELKRSEVRMAAIFNSALDCILTIDHEGLITEFNPAAEHTFGYRRDDVVGKLFADVIIPPTMRGEHRRDLARSLATGEGPLLGRRIEMTALRSDGREIPVELAITPIPLDGPPSFTVYLRDLTERKQTEATFRAIVETTPECVTLIALDGTLLRMNSAGVQMAGASSAEVVIGQNFYDFLPPEDRERYREFHEKVCAGQKGFLEFDLINMRGERRQMETRAAPLRHDDRSIVQLGVTRDITRRKQAEEKLRRSEERWRSVFENSAIGVALADLSGRFIATNPVYQKMLGYTEEELQNLTFLDLTQEEYRDTNRSLIDALLMQERQQFQIEKQYRRKDGTLVWVRNNVSLVPGSERVPRFIMALCEDVTERKQAEDGLAKARTELARAARVLSLGALTASIAHEVNQPLAGIITNAGACLRMLDADPPNIAGARETARRTIRDGNRASEVVTRLRALFSKKGVATESVDLNDAAREVIALSMSDLQRAQVILRMELADDLPPVTGDRVQLQQVILNLLMNAADAMSGVEDRPRQLVVRTEPDEANRVRLMVRDAGIGLEANNVDKLFEAFYTTKRDGMGIGLSVSRSIIEGHQGRLWVAPNDGPGATFSFSIPCRSEGAASDRPGA
jgi:PAS domain S-box-containing protein